MNRILAFVVGAVIVAVIIRASTFVVDQRQNAIVFQLGQITRVITEPGLYFRLPLVQNVEYQDRRILTIDTPVADRVQTAEKKNLLIDSFVRWRISEPRAFRVSFPSGERAAEERISTLVRDALNYAVNRRTVNEITSRQREKAMEEIRLAVQEATKNLGVEIVDVRLKRVDFVPEISESVYRPDGSRTQAGRQRAALDRVGGGREDPRRCRPPARGAAGRGVPRRAEDQGRRRCEGLRAVRAGVRPESGIRAVLSQPRGLPDDVQQAQRRAGRSTSPRSSSST